MEFILLAVVLLGIMTAGMLVLFTSLGDYFRGENAPFKLYVECLMQKGVVPTLGGTQGCELKPYEPGEFKLGKDSGKGGQGNTNKNNSGSFKRDGSGGAGGSDGATHGIVQAGGGLGGSRAQRKLIGEGDTSTNKKAYTGENGFSDLGASRNNRFKRKTSDLDRSFNTDEDAKQKDIEIQKKSEGTSKKSNIVEEGQRRSVFKYVKPKREVASQEAGADSGMTFGNFLKYLIIAAIIIILVFFIGGQLLQATKGME